MKTIMSKYEKFSVALAGCRTTDYALECCEYDLIILSDENIQELIYIDDVYVEIHSLHTKASPSSIAPLIQNMRIVNDPTLALSALKHDADIAMQKSMAVYARSKIVDALFYANKAREVADENPQLSSLWLKCAGYCYLEGVVASNGSKPMPTHMLAQLRSIGESGDSEGITIASASLGLERANRSSLSRCAQAAIGLDTHVIGSHSGKIISRKIQFLLQAGLYSDCYLYVGHVARNAVERIALKPKTLKNYMFMINIAMDLTIDQPLISKLSGKLINACNAILKRYYCSS
ncbi:MAG: hypothetical protein QW769_05345 [Nitrososphaerales archaeon]